MEKYFRFDHAIGPPESFNKKQCCGFKCCNADIISVLVAGYDQYFRDDLENCLDAKWSVGDCVAGCHNDLYHEKDDRPLRRHSHQFCIPTESIKKATKEIEAADFSEKVKDFEDLYDEVNKLLKGIDGIGGLVVYDTALRLGKHIFPTDILPEKKVYLQRGAFWGARHLQLISRLSLEEQKLLMTLNDKESRPRWDRYMSTDIVLKDSDAIPIEEFLHKDLRNLGSCHLENFLCIFHRIFEDWARGYEVYVANLREKTNKKERKNQLIN